MGKPKKEKKTGDTTGRQLMSYRIGAYLPDFTNIGPSGGLEEPIFSKGKAWSGRPVQVLRNRDRKYSTISLFTNYY